MESMRHANDLSDNFKFAKVNSNEYFAIIK